MVVAGVGRMGLEVPWCLTSILSSYMAEASSTWWGAGIWEFSLGVRFSAYLKVFKRLVDFVYDRLPISLYFCLWFRTIWTQNEIGFKIVAILVSPCSAGFLKKLVDFKIEVNFFHDFP